jgi:hypothetical protein
VKRVLPVALGDIKPGDLPQYLQATTVLSVAGNAAAEVRASVEAMLKLLDPPRVPKRIALALALGGATLMVSLVLMRTAYLPPQLGPCRDESHGVESYGKDFVVDRVSPWMGGGFSQDPWCAQVTTTLMGEYPGGLFEVVGKSESKKNTCAPFNCPQYQYFCKVRVRADPVYALQASPACK